MESSSQPASPSGPPGGLVAACSIFLVLPCIFVALRLYARHLTRIALSFNDYMIVVSLILTVAINADSLVAYIDGGAGQHVWTLAPDTLELYGKVTIVLTLLWPTANTCIKISVLHFYRLIFQDRKTHIAIYAVGALTLIYWVATILTAFLICQPFGYNWNQVSISGHCGDLLSYYLSTGILNIITDVLIVVLPLPVLWGLQMKASKKLWLSLIFSLGFSICVITIVRCVSLTRLDQRDVTYTVVVDNMLTNLEPTLGIINACLPILRPVLTKLNNGPLSTIFRTGATTRQPFEYDRSKSPTWDNRSEDRRLDAIELPTTSHSHTSRAMQTPGKGSFGLHELRAELPAHP